jgi:hypothetical protein
MFKFFRRRPALAGAVLALAVTFAPVAAQQASVAVDYDAIYKIKDEGFQRSSVMELASWLTDVHGPRLTNSPTFREAGDWAVKQLSEWGLANVKLEPWGPFGRGWSNDRFYAQATAPTAFPIVGYPKAWSGGTSGLVSGEGVLVDLQTDADYDKFKGTLRGKIAFVTPLRTVAALFDAPARRYTPEQLEELEGETDVRARGGRGRVGGPGRQGGPGGQNPIARRMQFFKDEGVLAIVDASPRGDGGTVFVQSAPGVSRDAGSDPGLPQITFAVEHYGRLVRAMDKGVPVKLELDVKNTF